MLLLHVLIYLLASLYLYLLHILWLWTSKDIRVSFLLPGIPSNEDKALLQDIYIYIYIYIYIVWTSQKAPMNVVVTPSTSVGMRQEENERQCRLVMEMRSRNTEGRAGGFCWCISWLSLHYWWWRPYIPPNFLSTFTGLCKIWGFYGGDYEEWCLLGCYAAWLL
jgi:hypothetical protein